MSLDTLYSAFVQAATQGTINATILPLMGKLTASLGVAELTLTEGRAERLANSTQLTGATVWANGTGWTLGLTGSQDEQGRDLLTLVLLAQTERGFVPLGTLVPDLPSSRIPAPDTSGVLMLGPSVLSDLGPDQATVTAIAADDGTAEAAAPSLGGTLVLTGTSLARYGQVLGTSRLALSGGFDPRTTAATEAKIALSARSTTAATDWPKMNLEALSLGFTTGYADIYSVDFVPQPLSAVLLVLDLSVRTGREHQVEVSAPLLQPVPLWDVSGEISPPLTLSDGIVALMGLFPGARADMFTLPSGVAALDAFGLSQVRFGIETDGDNPLPTGMSYTGATIVSTTPWDVPLPFIRIEEVGASWLVNWDKLSTRWSGSLFGTLRFGAKDGDGEVPPGQEITDESGNPVYLDVTVSLPDLSIVAATRNPFELNLSKAMAVFFPGTQPEIGPSLVVDKITMGASIPGKTLGATLSAHGDWTITVNLVSFTLECVAFEVTVAPAKIWGGLAGLAGIYVDGERKAVLSAGAYYPGDGSWTVEGGLAAGSLDLVEFSLAFLGQTAPSWLPALELTRLWAFYSTGAGHPYSASAALALRWDPEVLGIKLSLVAEADIRYRRKIEGRSARAARDVLLVKSLKSHRPELHRFLLSEIAADGAPTMIYEGAVKGSFELNNLVVTVGLSFLSEEMTWLFRLQLDRASLEARTAYTGTGDKRHPVLTVEMENVSLGTMIESLAALANPNANYRLDAPWSVLNSISLSRFTLVIDPTEQAVTLSYAIDLDLGFIAIRTVGIRYDRKTGEPQVNIEITGTFLGKEYGREPGMTPLAWDALNDSPPAVPGEGNSLVTLRYLGFGQHVTLDGLTRPDSLAEIVKLMRAQLQPIDDVARNPLDQPSGNQLHFDESSQWLIGLDVTVMGTVSVKLALHDPDLYGALIALAGPDAGSLAGFSFELLYKKVTDDIGVFHARLQVPDMFRRIDFGVVSITLGIITVDIFTNGNFKVDLGFPHARDFSVSFGLSYGPFLGRGGIYFGLLNGATSTRVPAITNGTFSPVLELGLGLAVGVGREFRTGPLAAGLYLQVEVIFEGVLAWYNSDDSARSKAVYFSLQGMAALVGKVYGKVDFKVISVDVSFEAYASVMLAMAAYRPVLIEMSVGVRVHASVKVLFVRVSFSFETSLDVSFTIGSAGTTPWVLAADQSGRTLATRAATLAQARRPGRDVGPVPHANASRAIGTTRRRRPADLARITRPLTLARLGTAEARGLRHPLAIHRAAFADLAALSDPCGASVYRLSFSPDAKVFEDGAVRALDVRILPGFTIASIPVSWPGGTTASAPDSPAYRVVMMLTIDGPAPVAAASLAEARSGAFTPTARAATTDETPFAILAEGLFRWAVSAIGLDPQSAILTAGDLAELAAQMDCPQTYAQGFDFATLNGFFGNNLSIRLSGIPSGDDPTLVSGVAFPMPPVLGWTSPDLPAPENSRDFAVWQPVDDGYAARIAAYYRKLSPRPAQDGDAGNAGGGIHDGESLASVIFRDYALLIAKAMVQAAQTLFASFPYDIDETSTLAAIAASFPTVTVPYAVHLGDTIAQVAETYGTDPVELLTLNPGLEAQLIAATPGTTIPVVLGVTPESIAAANPERRLTEGKNIEAAALETQIRSGETATALCARLGAEVTPWLGQAVALDRREITQAGATLAVPSWSYSNPTGLTLTQVAALFYVRLNAGNAALALVPETGWYAEAITRLNGVAIGADGALPATVTLPSSYEVLTGPVTWTRLTGDTLALLAAVTSLWQNPEADPAFATWLAAFETANPGYRAGAVRCPAATTALLPVETLRALAARLLLVSDPTAAAASPSAAFATLIADADILAPLAAVTVTDCTLVTEADQTLRQFATTYDLSIETVGRIGAEIAGLIAPDPAQTLAVPSLAAIGLAALMPRLTADAPIRDVAGQVSRFMLHGQRLPVPDATDDSLGGLFDLVGQQITGPAPNPSLPGTTPRLTLTLRETVTTPWIALVETEVIAAEDGPERLAARIPDFAARNPAAASGRLRPGMIVETADLTTLPVVVTEAMLEAGYPAATLAPVLPQPLAALPLWEDVPVRHGLAQQVIWQVATPPDLPVLGGSDGAPAVGMPSLWPFSSALTVLAAAADALPWQLYRTDPERGPTAPSLPVERFAWATTIEIRLKRIPGRPHTAEMIGADTLNRQALLEVWRYLEANRDSDGADLFFAALLSPAAGLAGGLAAIAADPDSTYLVRTNLTTETRSGNQPSRRARTLAVRETPPSGPYFAPMSNPLGFLTLLWEASVVGGGGYWLELRDADGNGFDDAIWSGDGTAIVTLISVLESQSKTEAERRLHPFNNAALIGDPVDTASTALFVAAPDDRDLIRQATVMPGNVGFTFGLANPPDDEDDPALMARRLYSLAGYRLQGSPRFAASHEGQPVSAQVDSGQAARSMRMARTRPAESGDDDSQTISQVIPIHRFAKTASVPSVAGLPPAADDPYAGISTANATAAPVATVALGFNDIFGNSTAGGAS